MKCKYKRIMTAGLAAVMLCTNAGCDIPAYASEAAVDVDETMYINLDYYGGLDKVNVVKGCSLNGKTNFTDYGTYLDVTNMSSQLAPELGDGTVTWSFPETQKERFYYKCAIDKEQVTLPWDFDVSYKLNGVPTDGDKLAGASGLVEINVKAQPNNNALEYYRNNLMLMVAVPVDMGKCYSVEADGSQTQNLGETTAVVFTALPGEEGDYTVRIGTDSFESVGVIMAMMPGTVEDLEHIKDLKEAKDTWQDAGDELYDSLEQMAKSVEGMRDGVDQVRGSLDHADSARQKWSSSKDSILSGNDQTLASLTSVSEQLDTMIPHLQTAKDAAQVVHQSMGDIVDTLGEMQDPLRKLHTRLRNIKSSAEGISENIPELMEIMQQVIALDARLQATQQVYVANLKKSVNSISLMDMDYYMDLEELEEEKADRRSHGGGSGAGGSGGSQTDTDGTNQTEDGKGGSSTDQTEDGKGGSSTDQTEDGKGGSGTDQTDDGKGGGSSDQTDDGEGGGSTDQTDNGEGGSGMDQTGDGEGGSGTNQTDDGKGSSSTDQNNNGSSNSEQGNASEGNSGSGSDTGENAGGETENSSSKDSSGNSQTTEPVASIIQYNAPLVSAIDTSGLDALLVEPDDLPQTLLSKAGKLQAVSQKSSELAALMSNLMDDTSDSAKYSAEIIDNLDFLIEDLTALNDSLDTYYPDLQSALDDSQELVRRTTNALNSGISTMTIVQNTLKDSSDDFDAAARESIRGSVELLDKSLSILDSTTSMRQAGRTMKDTIDNELDKFDTDNRFLFMDPSAEKVSFTSGKNRPPKTLQIVLRTDEISLDDDEAKETDAEVAKAKVSPLRRMWNVLVQMWKAMVSIFKNR